MDYFEEIGLFPKGSKYLFWTYVVGFALCLTLTFTAYSIATNGTLAWQALVASLAILALLQFAVQIYCFLHLGKEPGSRERLAVLAWAALIVTILVSGSIWIMFSLNGRMMPDTQQMENYMNEQIGF